ncbi:MAG: DegT/DnrJ/EryC1/StrS family aminotransferase [Nitrosopumilaceae archaeon]
MTRWKIPLYKVMVDKEDEIAVLKVLKRGMDWALGPEIEQFEKILAEYVGSTYCLAFNSGTSALHAALLAKGTKPTEEVIVPSFTFISTTNSVLMVNGIPHFVDIEDKTLGLDPILVKKSLSKRTRTVIAVHYAGLPCEIEQISKITKSRRIFLIEDAAEALGAKINRRMVGTFGDLAIFSFAANKVVTTGEGGAIVTNSKDMFQRLKLLRSHGRIDAQNYFSSLSTPDYVTLGFNWRMSSMTAALGISQLNKIEKLIKMRRNNAKYMTSRLRKLKEIKTPFEPPNLRHVYQLYSIQLPNSDLRNALMEFLKEKGIMTKVFFSPIHKTTYYRKLKWIKKNSLKITENISQRILSLPMYPGLKREEMDYIFDSVAEFIEKKY